MSAALSPPASPLPAERCSERPESCPHCGPAASDSRTERHLAILAELAEIGLDLARAVGRQALSRAAGEPGAAGDVALVFSRLSRAVRQTVALEAKLAEEHRARTHEAATLQAAMRARQARDAEAAAAAAKAGEKRRVARLVERAIDPETDETDLEDLLSDLDERLDDPEIAESLGTLPAAEIVARICRDLGLDPGRTAAFVAEAAEDGAAAEDAVAAKPATPSGVRKATPARPVGPTAPPPCRIAAGRGPP